MPPFDREAALKSAEKALRLGRVEVAIAEDLRIVEAQPRDWNSANALGDLYVKSKQVDQGIAQYTRIADQLLAEGFLPKAAALYKKILKFKPNEEYALLQSAEISAKQGLLAEAKTAYKTVVDGRRARGDSKGAAEISIKLGTLDPDDLDARVGAARAALEIGDQATALNEFRDVAFAFAKRGEDKSAMAAFRSAFELDTTDWEVRERLLDGYLSAGELERARTVAADAMQLKRVAAALEEAGKTDEWLEVLTDVAALDPEDTQVLVSLALAYVAKGDPDRARTYFNAEVAGRNAPLWLTLAEIELTTGRLDEGRAAVARSLELDPDQRSGALALGARLAERSPTTGFPCLDAVADAALAQKDYTAAATALNEFVSRSPNHIVALMRLVEICVDGGLEETMHQAQGQLADAYLAGNRGLEARIISEDLVAREPWNTGNIERFRKALVMLGESDPDLIIAERLSGDSPFMSTDKLDLNEGVFFEEKRPAPNPAPARAAAAPPAPGPASASAAAVSEDDEEGIDLDLGNELFADAAEPEPVATPAAAPAKGAAAPKPVAQAAKEIRDEVDSGSAEEAAAEQYGLAVTYRELGMLDDAIQALKDAAKSPKQRFDAATLLGTLLLERDELKSAIEWFERAAESPAPSPAAGRALLYDLAATLEKAGELNRSLAVFVELESEAGAYRDVAYRILRLSKLQAKE